MTAPIDYSRPVGWWCPVCQLERPTPTSGCMCGRGIVWGAIPVYLPIPEGQRPRVDDEVEDAEVVTGWQWGAWWIRPNPQTDSGWHTQITDALIEEITGATE